jgi:predicted GIY-YIG superfamily endonuclease/ribosome-associated protein YbcJ (S4-like RNA binding protein)
MDRLIILTKERLDKAKPIKGDYSAKQLLAIGVGPIRNAGWKESIIGHRVKLCQFLKFVLASKNKPYIEEIEHALPLLNPPVVGTKPNLSLSTLLDQHNSKNKPKSNLSRRENKVAQNQAKKEMLRTQRLSRIMNFGIHRTAQLIIDSNKDRLTLVRKTFLLEILSQPEDSIALDQILKINGLLKSCGITLSFTASGSVISKSFTRISKQRMEQLLYVIRAEGTNYCKIGVSKDPKLRKRELQTSNPFTLNISMVLSTTGNAVNLEKSLHKHFRKQRTQGEWFEGIDNTEILNVVGLRAIQVSSY